MDFKATNLIFFPETFPLHVFHYQQNKNETDCQIISDCLEIFQELLKRYKITANEITQSTISKVPLENILVEPLGNRCTTRKQTYHQKIDIQPENRCTARKQTYQQKTDVLPEN